MKKQTRKQKKKQKQKILIKRAIKIICLLFAIIIIYNIIKGITKENESEELIQAFAQNSKILETVEKTPFAKVSRYIVYGTHFNIEGSLELPENTSQIQNVEVIAKNLAGEEVIIDSEYTYNDNLIEFTTLSKINTGLDLESLQVTDYYILLKVIYSNEEEKYYSLENNTEYGEINYYTLTRNNSNNKIYINFSKAQDIPFLGFNITKSKLPKDVYDVVIDPGHGGNDGGAVSENHIEADIVLDCALDLKEKLENIGLKVLITRDGTESSEEYTANNMYDEDGRVTLANKSGAKILISLHLNSNEVKLSVGGVEVYAPTNSNLDFAKTLAENIVDNANTNYSQMETYKEEEGVYVREIDISKRNNSVAYNSNSYKGIFDTVPYLYIIRETGGIATGAYVDGSSPGYSENIYRNSNVGVESYLIELGYMNVRKDLNNILQNSDLYVEAIVKSVKEFYGID